LIGREIEKNKKNREEIWKLKKLPNVDVMQGVDSEKIDP